MVLFKDMNKEASDVLNKGFCADKNFEIEQKFSCPNPQFTATASSNNSMMSKSLTFKFQGNNFWDELKFSQSGIQTFETKAQIPQFNGLSMGVKYDQDKKKTLKENFEFYGEYTNQNFHSKTSVSPFGKTFSLSGMASMKANGQIKAGGEFNGGMDPSSFSYTYGMGYGNTAGNYKYFVSSKATSNGMNPFGKFTLQAYGKSMMKYPTEFAAEYQKTSSDKSQLPSDIIQFGGQWYMGDSYDTKVKAKMGTNMVANVAVTQKLSSYLTATVGAQFDVSKPTGDTVKYGMKFESTL